MKPLFFSMVGGFLMFEIKYEVFEDDIIELQTMNIQAFTTQFNQIYGCFTLVINGIEYLPFPSHGMRLETKRIFSELILTHFEFLIDTYLELQKNNYVAIKYVENSWTWLEFIRKENDLIISQLNIDLAVNSSVFQTNNKFFVNAEKEEIFNEKILWSDFETEIIIKTKELLNNLTIINRNILEVKCFDQLRQFINDHTN